MATSFERWEKDPFFGAAEEVQDSADRMESTYRVWLHSRKDESTKWAADDLYRDLRTAVGTTKWQLEEFQRAVGQSYGAQNCADAKHRHREFICAIGDHVARVESSFADSSVSSIIRLDEGERNELALFLSGPPKTANEPSSSNSPSSSTEASSEAFHGHRRTASANADMGSWKIAISETDPPKKSDHPLLPRRTPSLSVILGTAELPSVLKYPRNGARKLNLADPHQESGTRILNQPRAIEAFHEKDESCLDRCDGYYDKQLYGWYGALQRQLQRSQYQMQYNRPVQVCLSVIAIFLIVLVGFSTL